MTMDDAMFARYAMQMEREDFEDEIRNLSSGIRQLIDARKDTIEKLRGSADYLDSIWLRCRVSRSVGTSASLFGGGLTIAGGILTLATLGAAAPVLIAGIATSSVGAATNIGTTVVEKILNSKQIKDMNEALNRDREITLKIEGQIEDMRRYKESAYLTVLLDDIQKMLGPNHVLAAILQGILVLNIPVSITISEGSSMGVTDHDALETSQTKAVPNSRAIEADLSDNPEVCVTTNYDTSTDNVKAAKAESAPHPSLTKCHQSLPSYALKTDVSINSGSSSYGVIPKAQSSIGIANPSTRGVINSEASSLNPEANSLGEVTVAEASTPSENSSAKVVTALADVTPKMKYNPLDAGVLVEGGKVIGQNSFRLAGQVIIGISAAFLVWDAIDLGFTVSDLVKKKGSEAAMVLRQKADILEAALMETQGNYDIEIPD